MRIKTFRASSFKGFRENWEQHLAGGFNACAAVIFSSVELDVTQIVSFLKNQAVKVFGSTSCGEFLLDRDHQGISEGGLVCALLELNKGSFDVGLFSGQGLSAFELGEVAGTWAAGVFRDPAVLVAGSGLMLDGEQLVKGIQQSAGRDVIMYGGLAGDDAKFSNTFVFDSHKSDPNGTVVLVLDKEVYDVKGLASGGWVSIGADKIITRSEGNIVYTIDHEPALDVYKLYLNVNDTELPEIGVEYPLLIRKKDGEDVIRAVMNVDREKKSLIFAGTVPEGSIATFASSPGFEIVDSTRKMVRDFHAENPETDLLILFSCMARHNALGPMISEEIDEAWNIWKKPLIGFFTYGEIGSNSKNVCDFHNQTYTLVSIKEK